MLQLKYKNQTKGPLWLVEPLYTFGVGSSADISVSGVSASGHCAELRIGNDAAVITCTGEAGDVMLNGRSVTNKPNELKHGDTLRIGDLEFELVDPKQVKAVKPAAHEVEAEPDWAIVSLSTALSNKRITIRGSKTLGRSKECDISLGVAHLSRKHAKLIVTEQGLSVEDLGSSNGTFVNGQKIERAVLRSGDELGFDTLKFRVHGPKENLDSTTVRPVLKVVSESPTLLAHQRPAMPKPSAPSQERRRSKPKASPHQKTAPTKAVIPEEESRKGGAWVFVVLFAIIALGGVGWYVFGQA